MRSLLERFSFRPPPACPAAYETTGPRQEIRFIGSSFFDTRQKKGAPRGAPYKTAGRRACGFAAGSSPAGIWKGRRIDVGGDAGSGVAGGRARASRVVAPTGGAALVGFVVFLGILGILVRGPCGLGGRRDRLRDRCRTGHRLILQIELPYGHLQVRAGRNGLLRNPPIPLKAESRPVIG